MQTLLNLDKFGATAAERVDNACRALLQARPIVLMDDPQRENEGDLIASATLLDIPTMTRMIVDGSGIVCLTLTDEKAEQLNLPPMVSHNNSKNQTAFTVSIEAKVGVTTGVSSADRVQTIKTAIAEQAQPDDLARPGHVFPLRAAPGGVLQRRGHTEGSIDLCRMSGLPESAVLCELMNKDGTMMKGQQLHDYCLEHDLVLLTIEDMVTVLNQEREAVA